MPRRHSEHTKRSAILERVAGVKTPLICRRYGISERTLARWARQASAVSAPPVGVFQDPAAEGAHEGVSLCHDALRIVLGTMRPGERLRAVLLIESRLDLARGRIAKVLLGEESPRGCDERRSRSQE